MSLNFHPQPTKWKKIYYQKLQLYICTFCPMIHGHIYPLNSSTFTEYWFVVVSSSDGHLYIFPSFPSFRAFLPSVSLRLSCSSRWTYGHDFWCVGVSWWPLADFCQIKVKGQGQKSTKNCLFGPILGTEVRYGSDQDQGGSGGLLLAACQLILATCQKLESDRRAPLDGFPSNGKWPVYLARCQNW